MVKFLKAGGHQIAYNWIGEENNSNDPLIVFLHEGLGCMKQWKNFPQKLCHALNSRGLMYDRYGYGQSDALEEPRNPDYLKREACNVLPEILEKLQIHQKIILFGHSDGGTIALFFASCFPEKTLGLIAEAPHVILEEISYQGISDAVNAFRNSDLEKRLKKYHGEKTSVMFESWTGLWLDPKVREWNMLQELEQISSPLLVIQGDRDNYGSFRQMEIILKKTKGSSFAYLIKNCGHFPHYEFPEEVIRETSAFINNYCLE
jgi:pimeloyl-ACP methyl ester carboxylesterase